MFGSKKRKAEKEAARQAFVDESTQALADFGRREQEIAAMTDMGARVFALEQLAADIQKRAKQEENKIVDHGTSLGNTVGISSVVLGGIGVVGGIATAIAVALGGVTGAIKIDERAAGKAKRDGTYDAAFVKKLNHLISKCIGERDRIMDAEYNALSSSSVFDSVLEKYPKVKETFVARAKKEAAEKRAAEKKAAEEALIAKEKAEKQARIEEARRSGRNFTL